MEIGHDGGFIRAGVVEGGVRVTVGGGRRVGAGASYLSLARQIRSGAAFLLQGFVRSANALLGVGSGLGGGSSGISKGLALLLFLGSDIRCRVDGRGGGVGLSGGGGVSHGCGSGRSQDVTVS